MPRGHKASSSSMDAGFDRWISTKMTYGSKRPRVEDGTNEDAAASSTRSNGGINDVTVSLSIDEQHWLESLYTRACQNCLSLLGNEQATQEEACIEARCALDVDQQVHEQAFLKRLQRECATKRKLMMTVQSPNSDANTAIVIPKSLDFLSQFSASSAAGGDNAGGDMFGDCPFGDDEFADTTFVDHKDNNEQGETEDTHAKHVNHTDDGEDDDGDDSKEVLLAKRTVEIDAAVEAFREGRLAAFKEDESKIRSEREGELVKNYPLGTLDGDEQSVLLLELGTIWRQKLAEIVNPDSALRRRIAGDSTYAAGLVLGAQGRGSKVVEDSAHLTQNCLRHLSQHSGNSQSLFITANPDSAFLNLISEVAQRRIQAKMTLSEGGKGNTNMEFEVSVPSTTAAATASAPVADTAANTASPQIAHTEESQGFDEDKPISQLLANNPRDHQTSTYPKANGGASSRHVFRQDTSLLDAMAQVARLQAQITAKEEEEAQGGRQGPFQQLGWAQVMGQRNEAGRHFLSRCSGGGSFPTSPTSPQPHLPSAVQRDTTLQQEPNITPPSSPVGVAGYSHLMRVSRKQLNIEEAAQQAASKTGGRAHLPCDFPDEFTIPLGEMDEVEVKLIEENFNWPLRNLLEDQSSKMNASEAVAEAAMKQINIPANKKLEKKKNKITQLARAEEELIGLQDFTRVDLQNAILRGIPTLTGGTIRRRGDDIIVSGGSVLTIPTTSTAPQRGGGYGGCGEVALSSYVVSISMPGAL